VVRGDERCTAFDLRSVQVRLGRSAVPFVKYCHGGVVELVYPVKRDRTLVGAMFLGPFRLSGALPEEAMVETGAAADYPGASDARSALPQVTTRQLWDTQRLGQLLVQELDRLVSQQIEGETPGTSRPAVIARFLRSRMGQPLALRDLADHLYLSASRTSQLVRTHFGRTFPELLNEYRLNQAMQMLTHTSYTVGEIARQSGIPDQAYFQRLFKKHTGETPGAYRRRTSAERMELG
jgi:AraC-like DNA-binding protein